MELKQLTIEDWKNLTQIVFFGLVGFVTIASYLAAKKTILAPQKSEVLKHQLNELQEVMKFFRTLERDWTPFSLDLRGVAILNNELMILGYLVAHGDNLQESPQIRQLIDELEFQISKSKCDSFVSVSPYIKDVVTFAEMRELQWNQSSLERWAKTKVAGLELTQKHKDAMSEIQWMAGSPTLPKSIIESIEGYLQEVRSCYKEMMDRLNQNKNRLLENPQVPVKLSGYSQTFERVTDTNNARERLKKASEKIFTKISEYLHIDEIMTK